MNLIKIITVTIVLTIFLCSAAYSINLDSNYIVDNVIKSLKEEPKNWVLRDGSLYYANTKDIIRLESASFPDIDSGCLVEINFHVLAKQYDRNYVSMEKPIDTHFRGSDEQKLIEAIRQFMYDRLTEAGYKPSNKKEMVKDVQPPENEKEVNKDKMKKL